MNSISACRFCGSKNLDPYLDLGFTPLADRFLSQTQLREPEIYYPLEVTMCVKCGLHQLTYTVDPATLYQEEYPYESSLTQVGALHYRALANSVAQQFHLNQNDFLIEIGSNVGALLREFVGMGIKVLGVDPAKNIALIAMRGGIPTIPDFFGEKVARSISQKYGQAKVIIGTNVFAHISDHKDFIYALRILLGKEGIFIFESPYLPRLMHNFEYDTIYHEHLLYLSLKPVVQFFKKNGMVVFAVEEYPIHGGSFRVFVGNRGAYSVQDSVTNMLNSEEQQCIYSMEKNKEFADKVYSHRKELFTLLYELKKKRKRIAAVSAPAKGMTLLNYCQIGPEFIDFATEKSKLKIGKFTPGTHIPILSDSELVQRNPDYALLLAWNFADEIMRNLSEYKKAGGKFIIPIPKPRIV